MHKGAANSRAPASFDWDDVRVFLAVAREGSTIAAARALGINQSTVQRRLVEFERRVQARLVERQPTGYRLTDAGRALVPHAESVEAAVLAFGEALRASTRAESGVVRVTCPEPLVFLMRRSSLIERFEAKHPGLRIEFVMSDKYLELARGDADVALRSGDTDDGELIGRKIADSIWAVYASRAYVDREGRPATQADLADHRMVGFDETMANHRVAKWLRAIVPDDRIVARNDSVLGVLYAVKSGIGIAALPTALGDAEADLVRVLGPIPELTRIWRVLAHPSVRNSRPVAAFFDFVIEERETLQTILA